MIEHPSRQDGTYLSVSLARVNRTGTQLGYGHPLDPAGLRLFFEELDFGYLHRMKPPIKIQAAVLVNGVNLMP